MVSYTGESEIAEHRLSTFIQTFRDFITLPAKNPKNNIRSKQNNFLLILKKIIEYFDHSSSFFYFIRYIGNFKNIVSFESHINAEIC